MNQRIQKLIEECTSITTDMVYDGRDSFLEQTEFFDKEKFAELLIRECYEWAKKNGGLGAEYDYDALKEHFGVEE